MPAVSWKLLTALDVPTARTSYLGASISYTQHHPWKLSPIDLVTVETCYQSPDKSVWIAWQHTKNAPAPPWACRASPCRSAGLTPHCLHTHQEPRPMAGCHCCFCKKRYPKLPLLTTASALIKIELPCLLFSAKVHFPTGGEKESWLGMWEWINSKHISSHKFDSDMCWKVRFVKM